LSDGNFKIDSLCILLCDISSIKRDGRETKFYNLLI